MTHALVTVCIGEKFEKMAEITHPTMRCYCERIGAEFVVISGKEEGQEDIVPHFAKLQIAHLLDTYTRILFVDTDIIIRDDTPSLFDLVDEEKVGIFCEGQFIPRRLQDLEMASRTYSTPIVGIRNPEEWKGRYYNTGVMVVSRCHKTLFNPPDFEKMRKVEGAWDYGEQGWLNLQIINSATPVHPLSHRFNRMSIMDQFTGEHRLKSFLVHYAGAPEQIGELSLPEFIQADLDKWEAAEGDYSVFRRGLYIRVGGGLGDQVDTEPVVRKLTSLYAGSDIVVASDWPRIFSHLEDEGVRVCKVADVGSTLTPDQPYKEMETLPIPESNFGVFVSHPLVHSVDYAALSCLRTILSARDKQIRLRTTLEDMEGLAKIVGLDGIQSMHKCVAIHPGRGWPSKTFPADWWQEVIDGIAESYRVVLIGKHVGEDQGLVDVKMPDNGFDLRDKTTLGELFLAISVCPVLVSNDSSPIHIAGAFDNHIVAIPTCKAPEAILPWRQGSQEYKTTVLCNDLLVSHICNLPTQVYGETVDWIPNGKELAEGLDIDCRDELKGGDIRDFIPTPSEVVSAVIEAMGEGQA